MKAMWGVGVAVTAVLVALPAASACDQEGNTSGNSECAGNMNPPSASVDVGGSVDFHAGLNDLNETRSATSVMWTTNGGGHFGPGSVSGAYVENAFTADGPAGSYIVNASFTLTNGHVTSAPYMFNVPCNQVGEQCAGSPDGGCCGCCNGCNFNNGTCK